MEGTSLQGRKVLVTGAAGFIGSHICEKLLQEGAFVVGLDDFSAGRRANIDQFLGHPQIDFVEGSVLENGRKMKAIFEGLDTVFHNAASKKNICLLDPQRDLRVNGEGTLNLLLLSRDNKVRKFVHASTGSVYGEPSIFPTTEEHPLRPVSYYGVSKLAGERYVDVFHRLYDMNTTILRYFHVYGPRQESNEFGGVVSIFLRAIAEGRKPTVFGSGNQVRSFTLVSDLAEINLRAATYSSSRGQIYNAASGIKISILELAQNLMRSAGLDPNHIEYGDELLGDIMNFDIDNSKVRRDLSIEFETDFWGTLEGIADNLDAFLNLGS